MKKQKKIKILNISIILCVLIIIIFLLVFILKIQQNEEVEIVQPLSVYYKTENFELYIAPNESIHQTINGLFEEAKEEINCVFRSMNYYEIENKLREKEEQQGIKVRLFVNSDYMGNKNIYWPSTRFDDPNRKGMQHSNYCVIDKEKVFTGSLILNKNTIEKNLHTFVIIESIELADRYNSNFWQLYNNQSPRKGSEDKDFIELNDDLAVKPYFCPYDDCERVIVDSINNSKERISLAVYSFTNEAIFQALLDAQKRDVLIQGVIERKGITRSTIDLRLIKGLIPDNILKQVHTKSFLFDDMLVIAGCMNPTYSGVNYNDENILVMKSEKVNELYYNFMEVLYNSSLR